jgi:hypothetical protein
MDKQQGSAPESSARDCHGVLVGWSSQDLGGNMALNLQTFDRHRRGQPDRNTVVMTRSQAAVLANYLLKVARMAPPPRKKGWLASLFG